MTKHMARPDDRYLFDLSLTEIAKIALGSLIGALALWAVAFGISLL